METFRSINNLFRSTESIVARILWREGEAREEEDRGEGGRRKMWERGEEEDVGGGRCGRGGRRKMWEEEDVGEGGGGRCGRGGRRKMWERREEEDVGEGGGGRCGNGRRRETGGGEGEKLLLVVALGTHSPTNTQRRGVHVLYFHLLTGGVLFVCCHGFTVHKI